MHAVTLLGLCSLHALQKQGSKSYDDERRLEPADKRTRRIGTARDSRSSQQQLRERRLCSTLSHSDASVESSSPQIACRDISMGVFECSYPPIAPRNEK